MGTARHIPVNGRPWCGRKGANPSWVTGPEDAKSMILVDGITTCNTCRSAFIGKRIDLFLALMRQGTPLAYALAKEMNTPSQTTHMTPLLQARQNKTFADQRAEEARSILTQVEAATDLLLKAQSAESKEPSTLSP